MSSRSSHYPSINIEEANSVRLLSKNSRNIVHPVVSCVFGADIFLWTQKQLVSHLSVSTVRLQAMFGKLFTCPFLHALAFPLSPSHTHKDTQTYTHTPGGICFGAWRPQGNTEL